MKNQRTSIALTQAETRILGLKTVNPNLDFGNDRSITQLNLRATELREKLADYNDAIAALESKKNELRTLEKEVNELSSIMLKGVGFQYGQDSYEYELAGGVRTSDRVRKSRITRMKATTVTAA
jgi:chromosome condensin MukBEF ATPase and DNA-binding subunit MukB